MTDNEIIKALECCISHKGNVACKSGCPFHEQELCIEDGDALLKHSLDLINRQKAEIERLKAEAECADGYADALVAKAKSEAIQEFTERLKNEIISDTAYGCDSNQHSGYYDYSIKIGDMPEYIDDLVKEMVGESNV